jgi:virulence factor Mce-like protein
MITRLPSRASIGVAAVFVLASILLTMFVWRSVGGSLPLAPRKFEVKVLFGEAGLLTRNADVRISGVTVGSVVALRRRGLRTEATLSIESEFAPLPSDIRAILRQKTLLGETFVALSPGSRRSPPLREGSTLPVGQVQEIQPLDRILGTLDSRTRSSLIGLFANGATMLDGRTADTNAGIGNVAIGMGRLETLVEILDGQEGAVRRIVRDGGTVLRAVGDERDAVRRLVGDGNRALSATASRRVALTETVRALPALLRELTATSRAVERTAVAAGPTLSAFRPIAPRVRPALESVRDIAPDLRALLTDVEGIVPLTQRALPAAAAIVDALSPLMSALQPAAGDVTPVIAYVGAYQPELVATMANVRATTNGRTADSKGAQTPYLRTLTMQAAESRIGRDARLGTNRHNAYRAPGGLMPLAEGLTSSNCANAGSGAEPAPACKVQPPWSFAGAKLRYYPHVEAAGGDALGAAIARLLGWR